MDKSYTMYCVGYFDNHNYKIQEFSSFVEVETFISEHFRCYNSEDYDFYIEKREVTYIHNIS